MLRKTGLCLVCLKKSVYTLAGGDAVSERLQGTVHAGLALVDDRPLCLVFHGCQQLASLRNGVKVDRAPGADF